MEEVCGLWFYSLETSDILFTQQDVGVWDRRDTLRDIRGNE